MKLSRLYRQKEKNIGLYTESKTITSQFKEKRCYKIFKRIRQIPIRKSCEINYNDFMHDFGKNITKESLPTLIETDFGQLTKELKNIYFTASIIKNLEIRQLFQIPSPLSQLSEDKPSTSKKKRKSITQLIQEYLSSDNSNTEEEKEK